MPAELSVGVHYRSGRIVYVMEDSHQARELAVLLTEAAQRTNDSGWREDATSLFDAADEADSDDAR